MSKTESGLPIAYEQEKGSITALIDKGWYDFSRNAYDYLAGRLLTLADASFQDSEQRKANKDMIKRILSDWLYDMFNYQIKISSFRMGEALGEATWEPNIDNSHYLHEDDLKFKYTRTEK